MINFPEHKAALHLSHNEHLNSYETVEQYLMTSHLDEEDFVSHEEMLKSVQTNELWVLQWYPDTPVGFCVRLASTLEALLA